MKKKVDYIIVGQGLAGTMLAWFLEKKGKSIMVIDNHHIDASSIVAAGIINPITGRRFVRAWRIESLLPFAKNTFSELSNFLGIDIFLEKKIFRSIPTIKDENNWAAKQLEPISRDYIEDVPDENIFDEIINGVKIFGVLKGGGMTRIAELIRSYKIHLVSNKALLQEKFDYSELKFNDSKLEYKSLVTSKIIFAEGFAGRDNPWFGYIPYELAKGEVLIIKIKNAKFDNILKHRLFIVPLGKDLYWVGSGYEWEFEDSQPTKIGRRKLIETLDEILKLPYEIIEHKAAVRPCIKDRRPVMGAHDKHKNLYLFNGLGTKGASLAPFWANHLVNHLVEGDEIDEDVDIIKYDKYL
ncbi:MAG: FAD-binding oxidoreductase [Saprospiraceae bacterium]